MCRSFCFLNSRQLHFALFATVFSKQKFLWFSDFGEGVGWESGRILSVRTYKAAQEAGVEYMEDVFGRWEIGNIWTTSTVCVPPALSIMGKE